ncbi:MAG: hypothetical protein ACUVS3_13385 [Thermodesulfobacteriota bacterium]
MWNRPVVETMPSGALFGESGISQSKFQQQAGMFAVAKHVYGRPTVDVTQSPQPWDAEYQVTEPTHSPHQHGLGSRQVS